jgi:hypothetical protein
MRIQNSLLIEIAAILGNVITDSSATLRPRLLDGFNNTKDNRGPWLPLLCSTHIIA